MHNSTMTQQQRAWVGGIEDRWRGEITSRLWHPDRTITAEGGAAASAVHETLIAISNWLNRLLSEDQPSATPVQSTGDILQNGEEHFRGEHQKVEADKDLLSGLQLGATNFMAEEMLLIAQIWAELPVNWADLRLMWEQLSAGIEWMSREHTSPYANYEMAEKWLDKLSSATADIRLEHLENQAASRDEETLFNQHLAGRFLSNASHEIRTPLTAVLGFAELLLEDTYGALTPDQQIAVGHIENSAKNLLEIINNLLDLLHIRAGKLSQQYRTLDSATLLKDIYKILLPLANRKNVQFTINLPDDLGTIETDENIFRHIVYHLLASALRATPSSGKVFLTASRSTENLMITTYDTALHLPPEALPNMLEPYPLLENSPTRGYEGLEIGLPLVLRYIEMQNGTMAIDSMPDEGTRFCITLPLINTASAQSVLTF